MVKNKDTLWKPVRFGRSFDGSITEPNLIGTSLMGEFTATYHQLEEIFGKPNLFDALDEYLGCSADGKVTTEWVITNGIHTCIIYDYKATSVYNDDLPNVEFLRSPQGFRYDWHIGGVDKHAANCLEQWIYEMIAKNGRRRRRKKKILALKATKKFKKRFESLIIE